MSKKQIVLSVLLFLVSPLIILSQTRSAFTGDVTKFRTELISFMGPNLNPEQTLNLSNFLSRWDSAAFSSEEMVKILDISSQMSSRGMRPIPHFNDFLITLNSLTVSERDKTFFTNWIKGLTEITFSPRFTNDNIDRYFKNTVSLIKANVLYESGTVKWKIKNCTPEFLHDTLFYVRIKDATLTCYSQKDSTEIYNVTGSYFPEIQQFKGLKGTVTWEKAGFTSGDVFAEISDYTITLTKSSYSVDSAMLKHYIYFKEPVMGKLSDQATGFATKEKANFPRFETYKKEFLLKDIYQGVNYEGGLAFEGASVKGSGDNFKPARITMYRNDTLYLRIRSKEFLFTKTGLNSQETSISLYLDKDSIFHSNLGFSYFADSRQVNLFRTNNPISKSPYFNSFHSLDMYFEYLSWNMSESKILLSRARGAALGQAQFESTSFFNSGYFMKLMGIDDYHPLNRLVKFAEWFYSETFPVPEFAKWLNRPLESVTGLCIDMANKGFVFYDRANNEVTIKKKTKDFLDSFAKRKDYDVINIISETKAPTDNAVLDLKNYNLTINGVSGVLLSDSQRVAIYPYKQQLVIGKNRQLEFDGVVEAGLFTVFGHNFSFSYDTFKIRLQKIDSIKIAVETKEKDVYGRPVIKDIDNLIQLGTAELYIDKPENKSGRRSYSQYPIINAVTYSYIFYDKIPGLEGIYKQSDFYFRVDPFTYENIDHYSSEDMNLSGQFFGGKVLKPMKQYMTIQENNSLGFNMIIPQEGVEVYEGKAIIFDQLSMSNKGLVGSGKMKYLTSVTQSEEYNFFPDSMLAAASSFDMAKDISGKFPELSSKDVRIKWLPEKNEWLADNSVGKSFNIFANGTTLDGSLKLTPVQLNGNGIINTSDSRITSNMFSFASNALKADTADYNLKSLTTTGYSFIAENANTEVNFDQQLARFRLNTDSSLVKFPEIQYLCTMTDFTYNMRSRILNMEQKGKSNTRMLTADQLLKVDYNNHNKPTFFATNNLKDTVSFSSWKGSYHLDQEYIQAENIDYIHVADALIQPDSGKIIINRRAKIKQMQNAIIALSNKHILHSAKVDIESDKRYTGSAIYDYVDEAKTVQQITFPELTVDTLITSARGYIPATQKFLLSKAFTFSGDVMLRSKDDQLTWTGSAGIVQTCTDIKSYNIKFKSKIDPLNVMIPVGEKPRDANDNLVFSGSFISADSIHIYPTFLSAQKSWSDIALVNAQGYLYYEKSKSRYIIASREKLIDPTLPGNMIAFDQSFCVLTSEGNINTGAKLDLVKLNSAGKVLHAIDSGRVTIETVLALDFFFSEEALKIMADELRMIPTLKPVNLNTEFSKKAMSDLLGTAAAKQLKEEMDLFGTSRNMPKEYTYKLLLNDVNLYWNEQTTSFRSTGKIGIGFVGSQPINTYVDGYIEIQRRRSGDMVDVYLKADESTWYYFSYIRGTMMTQAGNNSYNTLINSIKLNDRKHPESTVRVPYTYMIAVEDRLSRFLRRMTSAAGDEASNQ